MQGQVWSFFFFSNFNRTWWEIAQLQILASLAQERGWMVGGGGAGEYGCAVVRTVFGNIRSRKHQRMPAWLCSWCAVLWMFHALFFFEKDQMGPMNDCHSLVRTCAWPPLTRLSRTSLQLRLRLNASEVTSVCVVVVLVSPRNQYPINGPTHAGKKKIYLCLWLDKS